MKAIVISRQGGPEQLVLAEAPDPSPGPSDILVRVEAAGINFLDVYHRSGLYDMSLPFIPGVEGAGTVLEVGREVREFEVGDRVAWTGVIGSYAEMHAVPADKAIPIPDGMDTTTVAAVLLQGLTAHYLATDTFRLTHGDRCLIHAGAGGVGLLLTQIAKMRGAEVLTTVSTTEKAELSRKAGADHVIIYTQADFKESVEDLVGLRAIDVVYDGVGATTFLAGLELLRPRGLMVTFGNASGPVPEISPLLLAQNGSLFLTRPTMAHYLQTRDELLSRCVDLFTWIREGDLQVTIGAQYPMSEAAKAHRALEERRTTGKTVLRP